jgi:hypothetical protein
MPTLDDAPITPRLVGSSLLAADVTTAGSISRDDLIQVFDTGTKTAKTITVRELGKALGVTFV